ncbi:MAG: glycogen/starch synthase [Erysipelotrichaceae bacterium]|nr:glycogen/starch synthase [Erysipelotrichaceae bacterium]
MPAKSKTEEKKTVEKKKTVKKTAEKKVTVKKAVAEKKPAVKKTAEKKTADKKKPAEKKVTEKKPAVKKTAPKKTAPKKPVAKKKTAPKKAVKKEEPVKVEVEQTEVMEDVPVVELIKEEVYESPRRSIAFIGSECYPFVKTGGLADVMSALPKELAKQNCDVRVILPRYRCIKEEWQNRMIFAGDFQMDLCADGRSYYVGIMEYINDGVVYDFIDNEEFFSYGSPYTSIINDIPRYLFFSKAALAALNYLNWTPNVIHCHDWQTAMVPVFLKEMFQNTPIADARTVFTIHNLRFQGIYDIDTFRYWTGLPTYVLESDMCKVYNRDVNMLKAGVAYSDAVTTVSNTYAGEIQSREYGENLEGHLQFNSYKLRGIVNGIDYEIWNPKTDNLIAANYDADDAIEKKKINKRALQEELGLEVDDGKIVIGLISRLTDQKGLDIINMIIPDIMDGHTQVVVLGSGDPYYENSFRQYENEYKGSFCANIMYDEARSHKIYAGVDCFLVPSAFEPCGLTQLIAMRYGSLPIVRETGGLKDTVEPYNEVYNSGNGFSFDRYDAWLLYDAINRAKTLFFTNRYRWDEMVIRDMYKDVSWPRSAALYKDLYLELTQW